MKVKFKSLFQTILMHNFQKENIIKINKDDKIKELKSALYKINNKICYTRKQDNSCFMKDIAIEQDQILKEIFIITTKAIK